MGISFANVTKSSHLREELEHANRELERAYEELQSTNEELETTNEELQSTVEELETMNEELHSTNDELQDINQELRNRSLELDRVNAFIASVLSGLGTAVVVVDAEMLVQSWNPGAEELWGLRLDEVLRRHVLSLDIGLPMHEIAPTLRRLLTGDAAGPEVVEVEAINRRGRVLTIRVTVSPLMGNDHATGVIMVMDPVDKAAETSNGEVAPEG